jgi:hypothetical protein
MMSVFVMIFVMVFVVLVHRGYTIYIDEGFCARVFVIMGCIRRDIADLPGTDLTRSLLFANESGSSAGQKNEQLFVVFGAVLAAGFAGL